jgi:carboxyl-terminal processing protease
MKKQTLIQILNVLFIFLMLCSCDFQTSSNKDKHLQQDLIIVTDSISQLMSKYHYNPTELSKDEYLELEKKVKNLAKSVKTRQDFINGFNELWKDGPFSHVRLGFIEKRAYEMANYIDTLNVGNGSVSLDWVNNTAVLTITTMTGLDTKEQVFDAFRQIANRKTESLIIDLRNNTGGTFAGVPLIGHVLTDSIDAGIFVSRKWWENNSKEPKIEDVQDLTPWQGWSIKSFWHDVQELPLTRVKFKPMNPQFNGPVYVLISNKTASAAEFTVDALAQGENVTIIGNTTAGEMLSQKMYDLPHGFQLSIPIAEYYSLRIGRIEGKGVEPDISINQSVAMDLAISLIDGEILKDALAKTQKELDKMNDQPFKGEPIYLLGNMNDWGKNLNNMSHFEYKGNGIYEALITIKKGLHEFKIAPMDWAFDYGANSNQGNVILGKKTPLSRVSGSGNLKIDIKDESKLTFSIDVSNKMDATLYISKK